MDRILAREGVGGNSVHSESSLHVIPVLPDYRRRLDEDVYLSSSSSLPFPVDLPDLHSARQATGLSAFALTIRGSPQDTPAFRDSPVRGPPGKSVLVGT